MFEKGVVEKSCADVLERSVQRSVEEGCCGNWKVLEKGVAEKCWGRVLPVGPTARLVCSFRDGGPCNGVSMTLVFLCAFFSCKFNICLITIQF